ncbi:MAG: iron complex outermembrane receptor protein [Rhodothermales bacterium]|jgi:iron complex outermembrane receptor protein
MAGLWSSTEARAQAGTVEKDSLRFYELSEIVVGEMLDSRKLAQVGSVHRVPLAAIVRSDAADVAGLARLLPSAHIQTNSRGESLIYLRNSGERQVAVFLDGALLNIPWDNRVDLSAVPASVLGGITVTQGAGSVLYGANVLGGVVNLATRSLANEGRLTEMTLVGGSGKFARADGMYVVRRGRLSVIASGGYNRTDGFQLAGNHGLEFSQANGGLRTNTDRRIAHAFVRAGYTFGKIEAGVSLLHIDSQKGIAPEGHLDPSRENVRYWRYPVWRTTMVSGNAASQTAGGTRLRGTVWLTGFQQQIDQFASADYNAVQDWQRDRDLTGGGRLTMEKDLGPGTLRSAVNGLISRHKQVEGARGSTGELTESEYAQRTFSLGSEYAFDVGSRARIVAGGNLDWFETPSTEGKSSGSPFAAWGGTTSFEYDVTDDWRLLATVGRKARFPTMRELFGEALNRFIVNEGLKPESALLADVGFRHGTDEADMEITAFFNRTWHTIDQLNVEVDGQRLRQRINLAGSSVLGLQVVGRYRIAQPLRLDYGATFTDPTVLGEPDRDVLMEKPAVLGRLGITVTPGAGGTFGVESVYTGRAYSLDPENAEVALPRVLQWNVRVSVRRYTRAGIYGELFLRLNNLTDKSVFPQLGLPGPGRNVQLGLSLSF